jgi:amino acid adenylation domain-containing protein
MISAFHHVLRDDPAVCDHVIVARQLTDGTAGTVIYAVPRTPWDPRRLQQRWHALAGDQPMQRIVALASMPLTDDGAIDCAALQLRPLIDDKTLAAAEAALMAQTGVGRAVALDAAALAPAPLHLADLLPGWQRPMAPARGAGGGGAHAEPGAAGAAALSDGGDLRFPADAPRDVAAMLRAAARQPAPSGIVCIHADGRETRLSYAELLAAAQQVLGGLRRAGVQRGAFVVLHVRDHRDFFEAFWACLLGGIVPVPTPIAPTYAELNGNVRRLGDAIAMLDDAAVICGGGQRADLQAALRLLGRADGVVLEVAALRTVPAVHDAIDFDGDDLALMMLTSGSTGAPKGVPLAHRQLVARSFASCQVNQLDASTVTVNWMPLDHVGGLILMHLRDLWAAALQVHVATELVTRDPLYWLDLLDRVRATSTFAPNFAYGLVCGHADAIARRRWDLSAMRCIVNGGEAIVPASTRRFLALLAPHGLPGDAMVPAWGMSETSSGVTYWHGFRLDTVGDADPCVPVGPPLPGVRLRIVDDAGALLREGQIGHLQVSGATLFGGYFGGRPPREEAFTADGWFRTGDLARLGGGVLSITGRDKDVIIINGANFSGPAIEAAAEETGLLERSFTAACAVGDPRARGGEGLAVFFVPHDQDDATLVDVLRAVRQRIVHDFGIGPTYLVPVSRDDIPKTSLGKIQRRALQQALATGAFEAALRRVDRLGTGEHTVPSWFFRRHWRPRPLAAGDGALPLPEAWLLAGDADLGAALLAAWPGAGLRRVEGDRFDLPAHADAPLTLVCLWPTAVGGNGGGLAATAAAACARIATLVAQLRIHRGPVRLVVVTRNAEVDPVQAAIGGLLQAAARESATLACLQIDLRETPPRAAAQALLAELAAGMPAAEVRLDAGRRQVPVLRRWAGPLRPPARPVLRHGGHYLVAGGSGGVGMLLAQWLQREFDARVLVVGRRAGAALPGLDHVAADVADVQALRAAVDPVLAGWGGGLDGVFHLAAVLHESPVAAETEAGLHAQFAPKLGGAEALATVARAHDAAALVLFSSIVGVLGGAQFGAYAASSRALDAMAAGNAGLPVYCIDWSAWRDTGLNRRYGAAEPLRAMGGLPLDPEPALASLRVLLGDAPGTTIVGLDGGHPAVASRGDTLPPPPVLLLAAEGDPAALRAAAATLVLRDAAGLPLAVQVRPVAQMPLDAQGLPDLAALRGADGDATTGQRAPAGDTERALAAIWRRLLGVEGISSEVSFFELGGQSLLATQLLSAIGQRFGVRWSLREIFELTTIAEQAARIDAQQADSPAAPVAADAGDAAHAGTQAQVRPIGSGPQRLWFLDRMHPHNPAYHISCSVDFEAAEAPTLASAAGWLQALVDRHEGLRSRFPLVEGVPCQWVEPQDTVVLDEVVVDDPAALQALEEARVRAPFHLAAGPLLRSTLWRLPGGRARLLVAMHHAIADGWSFKVLLAELLALRRGETLPPVGLQVGDFCAWQRRALAAGDWAPQIAHWRQRLAGNLDGLTLPGDRPRPAVMGQRGGRLVRPLPAALAREVRALGRQRGVTLFVALLSAYKALLAWYAQQDDIVVGTVVANRNRTEFESLVGFVVNMLTLRTDLADDPRFVDILQRVQRTVLDAHAHQDVPFETLVDELQPPRDPGRSPLFQIAFDLRDAAIFRCNDPGVRLSAMEADLGAVQYDLHLTFDERGDALTAIWQFNAELFDTATVERLADNYTALLLAATADPQTRLSRLPLPSAAEAAQLDAWNATASDYPRDHCVHTLFAAQAARTPQAIAVAHGAERLSYAELDARANQLAHRLRALGVGPDVPVGLAMARTPALVVAILGILKAGGAYVPLDPEYPAERLAFMLADAAPPVVITQASLRARLPATAAAVLVLDEDTTALAAMPATAPAPAMGADALAYVIYTSGSTGVPKGVQVVHRSINRLVFGTDYVRFQADDRVAQVSVVSFDAATFELWGALLHGGTLVILDREVVLDPAALAQALQAERISVMFLTAVLFDRVARAHPQAFGGMRYMLYGGAAASVDAIRAVLEGGRPPQHLINGYGPTEVTTFAVTHDVRTVEPGAASVPIGRPIGNTTAHVVGRFGERVPIGVRGELLLGGDGVARGYLKRPELTAERFVPDRFCGQPGARLYRTGDVVRRRPDGLIDYLGRNDQQIKLRGFRIELGEVEATLCAIDGVHEAVVVVRTAADGDQSLAAYVTGQAGGPPPLPEALRQRLQAALPGYMVPGAIVVLARLPLSPNGKVDRAALPDPAALATSATGGTADRPQGDIERTIGEVWRQVLGLQRIDRRTNFFDAGGHSLKLAQVHALLSARLDRELTLVDLFRYPTIATLAAHLGRQPARRAAADFARAERA